MSSVADQLDEARKNELLDLTLRNPLISHRTLQSRGVEVIDERPVHVYQILVEEGRKMAFKAVSEEEKKQLRTADEDAHALVFGQPDASNEDDATGTAERHVDTKLQTPYTSEQLQSRLLGTYHHAQRSLEEEGVNTLFLALGMLRWYRSPSADTERKAPILLVPVELNRTDVQGRFRVEYLGDEVGGNLSLKAFLDGEFGIDWPLPSPQQEDFDLQRYANNVREAIGHKDRWYVDPHATELGFFSFSRFLMYEDLDVENWPDGARPDEHAVLQKLLGDGFEASVPAFAENGRLDDHLAPADTHHVVDADSSQTEAILAVKAGTDLVLQGPPGTGKSQTITNIIAEAIGEGKTVLFASEKMAALEVVKRNLDGVGLGDACLELHSHKTRKKAVLDELERTLNLGRPQVDDFSQEAALMTQARERLNTYADAVNEPIGDSGVRPYDAYGTLEQLREALSGSPPPSIDVPAMRTWTEQAYAERLSLVEDLESHLAEMGVPANHPFWGSTKRRFLPREEAGIEQAAEAAAEALASVQDAAAALADALCLDAPDTPQATRRLQTAARYVLEAPRLSGMNVQSEAWRVHADALRDLVDAGTRHAALRAEYDDVLIPEAWTQDVFEIRQALAKHGETWYRWLLSEWRTAKNDLAALCKTQLPGGAQARVDLVDAILEVQRLDERLDEAAARAEEAFGQAWRGTDSDWDRLQAATAFLTELHRHVAEGDLPAPLLETVANPPEGDRVEALLETLEAHLDDHASAVEAFVEAVELDGSVRFAEGGLADQPFSAQTQTVEACRAAAPRLQEMVTYTHLAEDLAEQGLGPVRTVAETWEDAPQHLADAFRHAYHNALLERALDERPALERFSGAQHEQVAERFRRLDAASLRHNRHELALKHYDNLPGKKGVGQMGVLLHEMGKKSRHMPLRRLLQEAGNAIQALKPVFMMSPMSVPKYLPPDSVDFDLVVFDEASQVRPVDAFGSILRGEQAVVVGDNKQLPPTSFFESSLDPERDDYERRAGDQESILDLFRSRGAPEQMLKFHYRSRHESLIAVSNKEFYDNDLNVFPSPDAAQEHTGLVFNHLPDTTYDRGGSRKNKGEAEAVAQRVMEHARQKPGMSLGVATFSSAQQEAIRDRLEYERRQDPSCEDFFSGHPDEPFFVKNLESVQGDQRDVMFISVGYGRDANGRVSMNFGPLNQDGGERRLNVLTTRAKYRCEVFTNLTADDIDLSRTDARGVEVLKEYLQFAETGELALPTPTGRGPDSPFEEAVADRLRAQGYDVEHQVGVAGFYIDLAVRDPQRPGRYLLGIECDGATYHSARMARVRDRTRQAVLENLGWTIHRIWSTDWFRNPEAQLGDAVAAIERAQAGATSPDDDTGDGDAGDGDAGDGEGAAEAASAEDAPGVGPSGEDASGAEPSRIPSRDIERAEAEEDAALPVEPYETASPPVQVQGGLHEAPTHRLAGWVEDVVQVESPVHEEVAARRIVAAAGVSRLGSRIREALEDATQYAARKGWIRKTDSLLFDPEQDEVPVRDRGDLEGRTRDIAYVPGPEIARAAQELVEVSLGIGEDELVQQVGRHLGFERVGSNIQARIESILATMAQNDQLGREDGHLVVPS